MTLSLPMCAIDFSDDAMGPEELLIADRIKELKQQLGDDLLILGHHYQRDQIVMHSCFLNWLQNLMQNTLFSAAYILWQKVQIF